MLRNYEQELRDDLDFGLEQGSMHFNETSEVHKALRELCGRLDALGVPYAVVGGMAMFLHGYERFTKDVDVLVRRESLTLIHQKLVGLGYTHVFAGSKHLRDTIHGVRCEFLTTGDFPGDGKPKPISFPDPAAVAVEIGGIRVASLPTIIEMKIASGMTNPGRQKDLGDAQELIKTLSLPRDLSEQLHEFVRERYLELWDGAQADPDPDSPPPE